MPETTRTGHLARTERDASLVNKPQYQLQFEPAPATKSARVRGGEQA